jgi:antitoxin component YwqK of YwqJK toxin-antitoxin module
VREALRSAIDAVHVKLRVVRRWPVLVIAFAACARPPQGPCAGGQVVVREATPRGVASWCSDAHGARQGPFERRLPGGRLVERGTYVDGRLHGAYASWYAHGGRHAAGRYERGRREGAWREWHENGTPWLEATYAAGLLAGRLVEREYNGTIVFDGTYVGGRLDGAWRAFRPDGSLRGAGRSAAGKLHGTVTRHGPDGSRTEVPWRDNRMHGELVDYDANGQVTRVVEYRDGVEVKRGDR